MAWITCEKCNGEGEIEDLHRPAEEQQRYGTRYVPCPNPDCQEGRIFLSKFRL